jgi:hypothetical protein
MPQVANFGRFFVLFLSNLLKFRMVFVQPMFAKRGRYVMQINDSAEIEKKEFKNNPTDRRTDGPRIQTEDSRFAAGKEQRLG